MDVVIERSAMFGFRAKIMRHGMERSAVGKTMDEAQVNLKNFDTICERDGHDAALAHETADDTQLALSAADREQSKRFTLDWLKKTNQENRQTSFKDG